jgi:protein N-terminal glutamine amidohydrolase
LVRYTSHFCEENVWHLARERADQGRTGVYAVFITNRARRVMLWQQRAGDPVAWDYHVVLFDGGDAVDLDTLVEGGPSLPIGVWLDGSFRPVPEPLAPRFRVVDAADLLRTFASDRSHMRGRRGEPLQPFPEWPPIRCSLGDHTLPRFLDLDDGIAGTWLDLDALRVRFG